MPRNFAIADAYVPAILVLFALGIVAAWLFDRVIAATGLYRVVWHPSLFRASLLVCICSALGLIAYR
jgi:hypothetical protein